MKDDQFVSGDDPLAIIVTYGQDLWRRRDSTFAKEAKNRLETHRRHVRKNQAKERQASLAESSR